MPSVRRESAWTETSVSTDAPAFCEQNVKPIGVNVETIGVCAIFGHVAEKVACLALSTRAYSVVVTFGSSAPLHKVLRFFFSVTQSAYVFGTQMAGL
jgi:hypothetical protein